MMIQIDGSYGEGGGQILRTSLALSLVTGKPFEIHNIRAGRRKPGLMHQHLTALEAARQIGRAVAQGGSLASQSLTFIPSAIIPGTYHFSVGTAGSCTLVFQTVLPALIQARGESELLLEGGTHNPFAPPFDFLAKTFLPLVSDMGPEITVRLEQHGFYPAGGGRFRVHIRPCSELRPFHLKKRGEIQRCSVRVLLAKLPRHIAQRELKVIGKKLPLPGAVLRTEEVEDSRGPGNVLFAELKSEGLTEVFSAFGERGVTAERVAGKVVRDVKEYLAADVPVGKYLADQLLIPLALAGKGSFRTLRLTRHTRTNMEIIQKFLDRDIRAEELGNGVWEIRVSPSDKAAV
ncbi:MAG: RNA 3'-terminal phosphate cyclase [Desulfococcaceae bacterium]|jgi:RNA 3'-terminal phosphate cyclase (ATP)|nr:RNA 3'-terminal phosphate cyclase [Desulfococcaceae bacterium]